MHQSHIYTPQDQSYEARLEALKAVMAAREQAKSSREHANDPQWSSVLGGIDEIEVAEMMIESSFSMASSDFQQNELKQAQSDGALTEKELGEIMTAVQRQQAQSKRSNSNSDESSSSHKQS
ncbi:MAG: hypothetical protein HOI61_08380 [Gammaproteobacteria bacterium]|jgi:hypothetical protein|nr:hypothetical protein [Gammaproteobacteria bacterium]MBT3844530.1 hypothetical protein [Gammaproteobacteria bacterium]MBT3892766.1 hypothetical protein [Gammaproteobacteria bacterium]MBT5371848.1 hypothetical protein [Gammaproteobacteria bacterium]MBT5688522.1 hypothetical protein [Gammaproteobacteria bacterium]